MFFPISVANATVKAILDLNARTKEKKDALQKF